MEGHVSLDAVVVFLLEHELVVNILSVRVKRLDVIVEMDFFHQFRVMD